MAVYRPSKNRITGNYNDKHRAYDFSGGPDSNCYADNDLVVIQAVDRYVNSWRNTGKLTTRDYGNYIKCRHTSGSFSLYAHLKNGSVPKVGKRFKKGQVIATIGNTGNSTGPHLHYEFRNSNNINQPVTFTEKDSMPSNGNNSNALDECLKLHTELVDENTKLKQQIETLRDQIKTDRSDFEETLENTRRELTNTKRALTVSERDKQAFKEAVAEQLKVSIVEVSNEIERLIKNESEGRRAKDELRQSELRYEKKVIALEGEITKLKQQLDSKDLSDQDAQRLFMALIKAIRKYLMRE